MPIFCEQVVAEKTIPVVRTLNFHSEKSAVSAIIVQYRVEFMPADALAQEQEDIEQTSLTGKDPVEGQHEEPVPPSSA